MRNELAAYIERLAGKAQGTIESDSVILLRRAGRVHNTPPVELREEHELSFPRRLLSVLVVSLQFV